MAEKKYISDNLPDLSAYCTASQLQEILQKFVTQELFTAVAQEIVRMTESGEIGPFQGYKLDVVKINIDDFYVEYNEEGLGDESVSYDKGMQPELYQYFENFLQSSRIWEQVEIKLWSPNCEWQKFYPLHLVKYENISNLFFRLEYAGEYIGLDQYVAINLKVEMSNGVVEITTSVEPTPYSPKAASAKEQSTDGQTSTSLSPNNNSDNTL